jgi:tRNA U38,U39,U40 pseudouridine synthase TruA
MELPKKPKSKVYFNEDTEAAIIKYNSSTDPDFRERVFRESIHGPLDKLAENVINRFKFPYMEGTFDDIKSQVVSFLVINLHKFTEDKGKAFSYFSVIAKNYLILHNNNSYKEEKRVMYFSDQAEDSFSLEEMLTIEPDTMDMKVDMKEFLGELVDFWEFNLDRIFKKTRDREIASALVTLIDRVDNIDNFNKKALYLMVREMTNHKTSHITKVINKMRPYTINMLGEFRQNGHLSHPSHYFSYKK